MIKMPAGTGVQPRRVEAPVSHLDIAPTLLELAGVRPQCRLDGISLLPQLKGAPGEDRSLAFECGTHVGINFACGTQSWSPGGRHDLYVYNASSDVDELFDLRDPDAPNLARNANHGAARKRMIERLGGILSRDSRWLSYWSTFRLDHYADLPRSSAGDMQIRAL